MELRIVIELKYGEVVVKAPTHHPYDQHSEEILRWSANCTRPVLSLAAKVVLLVVGPELAPRGPGQPRFSIPHGQR